VQTLADGTHIRQKPQRTNEYRDSWGRTRSEDVSGAGTENEKITSLSIYDPVAGFRYSIDPGAHTSRQFSLARPTLSLTPASSQQTEKPQVSREKLGTETIEGVLAEGIRTTTVYPVDAFVTTGR
jgi:hypothetical protein